MKPTQPPPVSLEGHYFALIDLQTAMAWASARPAVRLAVTTDHRGTPEVIEIRPPGALSPRWLIWRDHTGLLHVDDWVTPQFDLPYLTVVTALKFIDSNLAD